MSVEAEIEDTGRGLTVRVGSRYLYSRHQPEKRPNQVAFQTPVESRCLYFAPSPLLCYGLKEFADRLPEDSMVLAVEQSEELMALCSPEIPEGVVSHPSVLVVRLSDRKSLHALLYRLGPWRFRRVRRLNLTAGAGIKPELYDHLFDFLMEDLTNYWRNRNATGRLGRQWIRHMYANLASVEKNEADFRSLGDFRPEGIPVIAGAGPSLEASLDFLRENSKYLWILATDTAVPALLESGVMPGAIAVLETQAWNMLDFHGTEGSGIDVIADITAYPPSLKYTGGRCYLVSSEFAELQFLHRISDSGFSPLAIPPLGSVGLAAVEIALRMFDTNTPVFLTGLDFSYKPGKSHSRGSSFHRWQLAGNSRLNPQPGWESSMNRPRITGFDVSGQKLNTDSILGGYAALLTDRYAELNRLRVLAPGGINLGIPVISRNEAETLLRNTQGRAPASGDTQDFGVPVGLFLDDEENRLRQVIETWNTFAAEGNNPVALVESLMEMDQVFIDFPDEPPLPNNDYSFLVRAVDRCRRLSRYIQKSRQESSSSVRRTERNAD